MKDNYNKEIRLQCATCGGESSFVKDEKTGVITCKKCNRIYYGGLDELVELNQQRIDDEKQLMIKEVNKEIKKEIKSIFKKLKF
nr:hypothetical protein [uncultured Prevotella sp.]